MVPFRLKHYLSKTTRSVDLHHTIRFYYMYPNAYKSTHNIQIQVQELRKEHPKESDCGGFISIYVVIVEVLYWSLFDILVTFTCI